MKDLHSEFARLFIGFNDFALDNSNYPPFNVQQVRVTSTPEVQGDPIEYYKGDIIITLAVAGFSKEEIQVSTTKDKLVIKGFINKSETSTDPRNLHSGLALRPFERTFLLNNNYEVVDASLDLGLLKITLREIKPKLPEANIIQIN